MEAAEMEPVLLCGKQNWELWKCATTIQLEARNLILIVNGTCQEPSDYNENGTSKSKGTFKAEMEEFKRKDSEARDLIVNSLEDEPRSQILKYKSAATIWKKLEAVYGQHARSSVYKLYSRMFNLKYENDGIKNYISKMESMSQELKRLGEPIPDKLLISAMLFGLPKRLYWRVKTVWDIIPRENKTLTEFTDRLQFEEERLAEADALGEDLIDENNGRRDSASSVTSTISAISTLSSNVSSSVSAASAGCYVTSPEAPKSNDDTAEGTEEKKKDDSEIPAETQEEEQKEKVSKKRRSRRSKQKKPRGMMDMAHEACEKEEDVWFGDSTALWHMTPHRKWMYNYESLVQPIDVRNASGDLMRGLGRGSVKIRKFNGKMWDNGHIDDVLYVPELKHNLFSVSAGTRSGIVFVLRESTCKLIRNQELYATGYKKNKMYRLYLKTIKDEETYQTDGAQQKEPENIDVWHQRLGHQDVNRVRYLLNYLKIPFEDINDFCCPKCVPYQENILANEVYDSTVGNPGLLIHAGLGGPMEVASFRGAKYILLLQDDYSYFRKIYCLKEKHGIGKKIIKFLKFAQRQTTKGVKTLKLYDGLEDIVAELEPYVTERGIKVVVNEAGESNKMEKETKKVVEAANTMINAKDLDPTLWEEAAKTAVYLFNRSGKSGGGGGGEKTPFEIWHGSKPHLVDCQIFGAEAFVYDEEILKNKNDPALKGVFVGYEEDCNRYRVLSFELAEVVVSKDVVFERDKL